MTASLFNILSKVWQIPQAELGLGNISSVISSIDSL